MTAETPPPPPPPPAGPAPSGPRTPNVGDRFVRGDWLGALLAALAGLGVMTVLATGITAIDPGSGLGVHGFVSQVLATVALAVGGSAKVMTAGPFRTFGGMRVVSISVMPLFVSVLGFGAMAVVFTRRLRQRDWTLAGFVMQAVRLVVAVVVLLLVLALAARDGSSPHAGPYVRVAIGYSLVFAAALTLTTLVITLFFAFADVLPPGLRRWRDWLMPAAVGVLTVLALAWVLGTVYALVQILVDPHHLAQMTQAGLLRDQGDRRNELASLAAYSGNHAVWLLSWGMGAPLGIGTGRFSHGQLTFTHFTDQSAAYWALPAVVAVGWIVGAVAALRAGRRAGQSPTTPLRMLALALPLTGAIYVFAGAAFGPAGRAHGFVLRFHFSFWWLLLAIAAWSAVTGLIVSQLVARRSMTSAVPAPSPAAAPSPAPPPPPTTPTPEGGA